MGSHKNSFKTVVRTKNTGFAYTGKSSSECLLVVGVIIAIEKGFSVTIKECRSSQEEEALFGYNSLVNINSNNCH